MGILVYLVGLPASGKSTRCKYYEEHGFKIFSSDAIRAEIYGDESEQGNPKKVFQILHKRIKEALKDGYDCVYDATNVVAKRRIAFLKEIKNIPCNKICEVVWAPYETCLSRNKARERKVPEYVIERMYHQFQTPYYFEGWDKINVYYSETMSFEDKVVVIDSFTGFDQKNSHHKLSLSEHMHKASSFVDFNDKALYYATRFHDIGKVKTQTFYNKKDELSKEAHYYSHHNVGGYDSIGFLNEFGELEAPEVLEASALICYHMEPYFWENDKTKVKYELLWGDIFFGKIMELHKADEKAH